MKASTFDTSNYLNAKSAGQYNGQTLTIYGVKAETIRDKTKMIIEFESVEKTLVVNKTNRIQLMEAWGDETDDWRGKTVLLSIIRVQFEGKLTPSILITPHTSTQTPVIDADAPAPSKKGKK